MPGSCTVESADFFSSARAVACLAPKLIAARATSFHPASARLFMRSGRRFPTQDPSQCRASYGELDFIVQAKMPIFAGQNMSCSVWRVKPTAERSRITVRQLGHLSVPFAPAELHCYAQVCNRWYLLSRLSNAGWVPSRMSTTFLFIVGFSSAPHS